MTKVVGTPFVTYSVLRKSGPRVPYLGKAVGVAYCSPDPLFWENDYGL